MTLVSSVCFKPIDGEPSASLALYVDTFSVGRGFLSRSTLWQ